jgi:hypothetical protein
VALLFSTRALLVASLVCLAGPAFPKPADASPKVSSGQPNKSAIHDFDFFVGHWTIQNRRLKTRLAGANDWESFPGTSVAQSLLGGRVSIDEIYVPHLKLHGLSLRLFDPEKGTWSDRFLTPEGGTLEDGVTGGFVNGVGTFYGDTSSNGKPVKVRALWKDIRPGSFTWEQAASLDGGKTWETNWIMKFTRAR